MTTLTVLRRWTASLVLASTAAAALAGCSSGVEAPERSATCAALQAAVDGAQRDAEVAIAGIGSDPTGTNAQLDAIGTTLTEARAGLSPEEAELVDRAQDAVTRLARTATRAAAGKGLDGAVVGEVRTELLDVVKDARADC